MNIVIDASVITKLFIREDYSDKTAEILNMHASGHLALLAPTLIVYELGNVFWKHPQITPEKAFTFLERFLDLEINLVSIYSDSELLKNVCDISKSRDITFYDASYMALAERNETKMVTADEKMHSKVPDLTILLKEFKISG